jgi:hypothetical protein
MSPLAEFLDQLFAEGAVAFRGPPAPGAGDDARALLASAFAAHALDVAGPPIPLDAPTALAAAEVVRQACWFLVNRDETEAELDRRLRLPEPSSASQHLSGDLALRYLPAVHRRAFAVNPADALTSRLADLLRRWPLSGVLSDVADGPLTDLDFGGHDGLRLLYAERLASHDRQAWRPTGRTREFADLVGREAHDRR